MERNFSNNELNEIIDYLNGSCKTLSEGVDTITSRSEDELTDADHDYIDNSIRLCEQCGWWCESSDFGIGEDEEGDEEEMCNDCIESNNFES